MEEEEAAGIIERCRLRRREPSAPLLTTRQSVLPGGGKPPPYDVLHPPGSGRGNPFLLWLPLEGKLSPKATDEV